MQVQTLDRWECQVDQGRCLLPQLRWALHRQASSHQGAPLWHCDRSTTADADADADVDDEGVLDARHEACTTEKGDHTNWVTSV